MKLMKSSIVHSVEQVRVRTPVPKSAYKQCRYALIRSLAYCAVGTERRSTVLHSACVTCAEFTYIFLSAGTHMSTKSTRSTAYSTPR